MQKLTFILQNPQDPLTKPHFLAIPIQMIPRCTSAAVDLVQRHVIPCRHRTQTYKDMLYFHSCISATHEPLEVELLYFAYCLFPPCIQLWHYCRHSGKTVEDSMATGSQSPKFGYCCQSLTVEKIHCALKLQRLVDLWFLISKAKR